MGRSRKLDDQVSVKVPNANIYVKKCSDMFSWETLTE